MNNETNSSASSWTSPLYRTATNPSAHLGCPYDARTDSVLDPLSTNLTEIAQSIPSECTQCQIIDGTIFDDSMLDNLLKIDSELRLSLQLKIASTQGKTTLLDPLFTTTRSARYLFYHHSSHRQCLPNQLNEVMFRMPMATPHITATHLISEINFGIRVLVILKLPPDNQEDIDTLLSRLVEQLNSGEQVDFDEKEQALINTITVSASSSNIDSLARPLKLYDICLKLYEMRLDVSTHRPLEYGLRPIRQFYPSYPSHRAKYVPLKPTVFKVLQKHLFTPLAKIQACFTFITSNLESTLQKYATKRYGLVMETITEVEDDYLDVCEDISRLVRQVRSGRKEQSQIDEFLERESFKQRRNKLDDVMNTKRLLEKKVALIEQLERKDIIYLNVDQYDIEEHDDLSSFLSRALKTDQHCVVFCSSDQFEDQQSGKWKDLRKKWLQERRANDSVALVYADFTYTSLALPEQQILTLNQSKIAISTAQTVPVSESAKGHELNGTETPEENRSSHSHDDLPSHHSEDTPAPTPQRRKSVPSIFAQGTTDDQAPKNHRRHATDQDESSTASSSPPKNASRPSRVTEAGDHSGLSARELRRVTRQSPTNYKNILLLGESGVGKSTFINALVNYHTFESLKDARQSTPRVVMPVSFVITEGDRFDERPVRFGEVDPDEDHKHPGQSVTQRCKSYIFPIGSNTKLRIIDTPGMGDTRGLEQDDHNLQQILAFISNLSHLDAICILLKPNESRLNVVLRCYFNRLLQFLGPSVHGNIVFCFTNTRSTFFAPGDTGPSLKKMIEYLPMKDILYHRGNTFCFDSESFRYLVASRDGVEFDDYLREEYKKSWKKSVAESKRLIEYICNELKPCDQSRWQSTEHAQMQISQLTRPLLETIRNASRNIILLSEGSSAQLIKLSPSSLHHSAAICYRCPRASEHVGGFQIYYDKLHQFTDDCTKCNCPTDDHWIVEYKLEYELTESAGEETFEEMRSKIDRLRRALLLFARFHVSVGIEKGTDDLLLCALKRIVNEETQLCSGAKPSSRNSRLRDNLTGLLASYKEQRKEQKSSRESIDLSKLYKRIEELRSVDEIGRQLRAAERTRATAMSKVEKEV